MSVGAFVRVRCTSCGLDRLVAFSCKGRAVCPACRGRRMADLAAHLVDRVLPAAHYRQWTLSVPWRWRLALARDRRLLSRASTAFVRAVFRWQRQRARALGIVGAGATRFAWADPDGTVHPLAVDGTASA